MAEDGKREYASENTNPDGSYKVGKNKPPEHGKFQKDDGRKRGRRTKGTRNFASDFNEEMAEVVTLTVNGKQKKVSRQRSIIMRVADNASRGVPSAVKTVFDIRQKLGDAASTNSKNVQADEPDKDWSNLDDHEFQALGWLLAKLEGKEFEGSENSMPNGPLAYRFLPPSIERSSTESTVEGVIFRHFDCVGDPFEIISVGDKAYHSAALPRRYGTSRATSEMRV